MEAVATIGKNGLSIGNSTLQLRLKDEVKTAFDNATGNEIFFRKYKIETFHGRVWCIVKGCDTSLHSIIQFQKHCVQKHDIFISIRDDLILYIQSKQRKIADFDISSEDAGSIKNLPEPVSISNDRIKVAGIKGDSSFLTADNNLQDFLKDEVINAFKNYISDNHYGSKYKISIVDDKYECIIKGCNRSYNFIRSLPGHCLSNHNIRLVFKDEYIIAIEKLILKEPPVCRECGKNLNNLGSLKRHYYRVHHLKCKFEDGLLLPIMETSNESSKIDKPDTGKIQDNTNATNTTTNNMVSNRKHSHATAIHEEESNAKNAMLNPSESGYLQSSDTLSSISNSCEEGSTFSDRFLYDIIADDSFATPTAGNIDSINTNSSVTTSSISNSCEEGLTFGDRFLDSITADSFVIPTVSDNATINTDSQSYATPIVISDDNVTSFSWCDDYSI